jgi:hypothetical protein
MNCPASDDRLEYCDMYGRDLPHDYMHWNGAFYPCERRSVLEYLDPDQNCLDPIFGATFKQALEPVYLEREEW